MPIPAPDGDLLFTRAELTSWLGKPISDERAVLAEAIVWGWVQPILGWSSRPTPTPPALYSAAVGLGAIALENPSGLTRKQIGPFSEDYSVERREEILDELRNSGLPTGEAAGVHQPMGDFPPAKCYPDPAEPTAW